MLKLLLFPFAVLYDIVTRIRNYLYDNGLKPSVRFDLPVIGVGNLSVGGTGKTPVIEYLVRLLLPDYQVATLSRGYGRDSRGFLIASKETDARVIGDEPHQFFRKFGKAVTVAVGEERALAIPLLLHEVEDLDVILLDDSFQHRRVRPSMNILLTDFNRPFYDDMVLPAGRLRESADGAARADLILVTKCPPAIGDDKIMEVEKRIREITGKPVFFSSISYGNPIPFELTNAPCGKEAILVTGIANASPLVEFVQMNFSMVRHVSFPDHHRYTRSDMEKLLRDTDGGRISILTTEKDMVKMDIPDFAEFTKQIPLFYLPITVQFLKNGSEFNEIIQDHVSARRDKKSI
jgi:tetraacyldisaccharide 4'-kinase